MHKAKERDTCRISGLPYNNSLIPLQKNRGYGHKHAFSYDWWGMQNFHLLMRMGYAINAISEFTKVIKQYIKSLGVGAVLKKIKDTIFSNWLSLDWYDEQQKQVPQLRFQLE